MRFSEYYEICKPKATATGVGMPKTTYIDIMESAMQAYSPEHLARMRRDVLKDGLQEHGYPRVAANLGILIAHSRMTDRRAIWLDMMDDCLKGMPEGKPANDFSVKEIVFCLNEVKDIVPPARYAYWIDRIKAIDPYLNYSCVARSPEQRVGNWALFNIASEQVRFAASLAPDSTAAYIDKQLDAQINWFDENGMYRDPHEPLIYDLVSRVQLMVAKKFGYHGKYAGRLDAMLQTAAECSLMMQSSSGQFPYGGRSGQFLWNEAIMAASFEYEAARYQTEDPIRAGMFKRAARLAVESIGRWLQMHPAKHIKNMFPYDSRFGCEGYAYYDKYMATLASFSYVAYLFSEDGIEEYPCPAEIGGYVFETSSHFHKLFASCAGYSVECDKSADYTYECSGTGRIHKRGVDTGAALSLGISKTASYCLSDLRFNPQTSAYDIAAEPPYDGNTASCCYCAAVRQPDGTVISIADENEQTACDVRIIEERPEKVAYSLTYRSPAYTGFSFISELWSIDASGIHVEVNSDIGKDASLLFMLPVPESDGASHSKIERQSDGLVCCLEHARFDAFQIPGGALRFHEIEGRYRNRNGIYRLFAAEGEKGADSISVGMKLQSRIPR